MEVGEYTSIAHDVEFGAGCTVGDYCKLYPGTRLGNNVEFDEYSNTSGAVIIGDDCKIKKTAIVGQGSIMEPKCWLGPFAILIHEVHAQWHTPAERVSMGVYVHEGAVIGAHACVVAGVTVGYNAEIGAGAVVTKDCEENGIYVGTPARRVGTVPPERRVEVDKRRPVTYFEQYILDLYLPHLTRVGRYAVR